MTVPERRRAERHPVDVPGMLFLAEGRKVPVRIADLGELGALLTVTDLEDPVLEGERALLEHPEVGEGGAGALRRTPGRVVRVELDFDSSGVVRRIALFFDGGGAPAGRTVE
jgi:hypothetical protein